MPGYKGIVLVRLCKQVHEPVTRVTSDDGPGTAIVTHNILFMNEENVSYLHCVFGVSGER
jgi:hypothetical protein